MTFVRGLFSCVVTMTTIMIFTIVLYCIFCFDQLLIVLHFMSIIAESNERI